MFRTALLAASLLFIAAALAADPPVEARPAAERNLLGEWKGPACGGDWTYAEGGTFSAVHFTPGNNQLTGTWEMRWTALPPTLVQTCKTSDDPSFVGRTWERRVVQLDDESLFLQNPDQYPSGHINRFQRVATTHDKEFAALQGTWTPLYYEEGGVRGRPAATRHIIRGDKVTVQVNGETITEGKVILDTSRNPPQLDLKLTSGQSHALIYTRAGDYITCCGTRDGKPRPSAFATSAATDGVYLMVWKIERESP